MRRTGIDEAARETFDVIVIGGGITGVSTAREAALRGLNALLIEKTDFAAGTSSKSSKLVHGGLRYLQTYQFHLVAESLRERERLVKTAPHLVTMWPFFYLVYEGDEYGMRMLNLALTFYDVASEAELKPLVDAWRDANPNIVGLWYDIEEAALTAIRIRTPTKHRGLTFSVESGIMFIALPSGRRLAYVQPGIGENQWGNPSINYWGVGANKKW